MIDVDVDETAYPLELVVDLLNSGGVTGLAPTVAVRLLPSTNQYLDWADGTFKTAGWTTKFGPMAEVGGGIYQRVFDIALLALPADTRLSCEFAFVGPPSGVDVDVLHLTTLREDALLVRKYHTNRLAETSGSPGTLTLYDDDSATPLKTHQLTDELGNPTMPAFGTPARRSVGT